MVVLTSQSWCHFCRNNDSYRKPKSTRRRDCFGVRIEQGVDLKFTHTHTVTHITTRRLWDAKILDLVFTCTREKLVLFWLDKSSALYLITKRRTFEVSYPVNNENVEHKRGYFTLLISRVYTLPYLDFRDINTCISVVSLLLQVSVLSSTSLRRRSSSAVSRGSHEQSESLSP